MTSQPKPASITPTLNATVPSMPGLASRAVMRRCRISTRLYWLWCGSTGSADTPPAALVGLRLDDATQACPPLTRCLFVLTTALAIGDRDNLTDL
jgi:hypothetical protein